VYPASDSTSIPIEQDHSIATSEVTPSNQDSTAATPLSQQTNGSTTHNSPSSNGVPSTPDLVPAAKPNTVNGSKVQVNDENKSPLAGAKGPVSSLKSQGRRGSWISNLSSKFSSTPSPTPSRSGSVDAQAQIIPGPKSPQVEFGNPFDKKQAKKAAKAEKSEEPVVVVPHTPRRQSVLVSAGQERKLDQPGFLTSALRRLSSSNNATLGKGAGSGSAGQRRVMNLDPNRERIKITDFDQNKLKRVAFCVDVEIAGYGAQADEEHAHPAGKLPTSGMNQAAANVNQTQDEKKDSSKAKYKDMAEGAALKKPQAAESEIEQTGTTKADAASKVQEEVPEIVTPATTTDPIRSEPQPIPTTRKKEKKKRSEAERKERRERKRRQAEANGLVPMELSGVRDDDSDSSPNATPPGATTPRNGDSPTTDPLRIYRRCCQLRETSILDRIKDQISKPSATLAEAPGTVAVIDLSGAPMALEDIKTFGDWLAVVPVRKLVLDDCELTDEALRIILAGICGCKSMEQARQNRKLPKRITGGKPGHEQMGVIEKLSLKNNTNITNLGWKHIALFMHVSRSLKAIDLSGIPFPRRSQDYIGAQVLSRTSTASSASTSTPATPEVKYGDLGSLIAKALSERFGERLEEMILSRCGLAASNIGEIVDCCIKRKIRRLGLAENDLNPEGLEHVVRYVKSGACEGLDLGGNSLHDAGHMVAAAVDEDNPLFAMSLSDCNLTAEDLSLILAPLAKLKNFKFIDLSRNHKLFGNEKNAVAVLRKLLPRLKSLKRIHLADVEMASEHVIALAEMLPDCPELAHVSILDNPSLVKAMNSKEGGAQEEACAFLASLMTAVRVSRTIIAIELEVPSSDSSEVVKALASQIVAYSLRNMEYGALDEAGVERAHTMPGREASEVLLHLVGHMEGYTDDHDNDEPAPDEDYMIASTGIVKALGVCLGTRDNHSRSQSRNVTPTASGTATPRQGANRIDAHKKPKNVSLQLCDSARKIRMRLRPAMVKEDRAGNDTQYSQSDLDHLIL
jgi:hypothetical protein